MLLKKIGKKVAKGAARSSAQKAALKKAVIASAKARAKSGGVVKRTLGKVGRALSAPKRMYQSSVQKRTTNRLFKQSRATALNQSKAQVNALRTFQMQRQGKASNQALAKAFRNLDRANDRSMKFVRETGVVGGTINKATGRKGLITAPFTTKAMVDRQLKKTKNRDFAKLIALTAAGGFTYAATANAKSKRSNRVTNIKKPKKNPKNR
jgi:hypothetical protein